MGVFAVSVTTSETLDIADGPLLESGAVVSPDGKWVAFQQNSTPSRAEVFLQSFPKPGRRYQLSSAGGLDPKWSQGGREVVFLSNDRRQLMSVHVGAETEPRISAPTLLMNVVLWESETRPVTSYDVSSTGDRFLFDVMSSPPATMPIRVALRGR